MILKKGKSIYQTKQVLTEVEPDILGCDCCKKELPKDEKGNQSDLEITIFSRNHEGTKRKIFCSWDCLAKAIKKVKSDYFVTLPYLHYDEAPKGQGVKDFIKIIK